MFAKSIFVLLCLGLWVQFSTADDFYYCGEDMVNVEISNAFIAVQFDISGYTLMNPNWADFFNRHACLSNSPEPEYLARGFYTVALAPECGYPLAAGDLMTDPGVSRVAPVYLAPDSAQFKITDLVSVQFDPAMSWDSILSLLAVHHCEVVDFSPYTHNLVSAALMDTLLGGPLEIGNQLNVLNQTVYACATFYVQIQRAYVPPDTFFYHQWNFRNTGQDGGTIDADIDADSAWLVAMALGDPQLEVALLDDGVTVHEDLPASRITGGWDFVGDNSGDPQEDPDPSPGGLQNHGMACAGLIAASHNGLGVSGLTPNVKIRPVKIFDDHGLGLPEDPQTQSCAILADAIDYAANMALAAVDSPVVLSCSWHLGTAWCVPDVREAILRATKPYFRSGYCYRLYSTVVVFASGSVADRPGEETVRFPASMPEVIAVGATDRNDVRWFYSCYGSALDVMAPSGSAWTIDQMGYAGWNPKISGPYDAEGNQNYTATFGGTSAACPQVSGIAAMLLSRRPDFICDTTHKVVRYVITGSAQDLGTPGWDQYYGFGRVNAYRALLSVIRGDVNNDGIINATDVVQMIYWVYRNHQSAKPKPERCVGDCNCDGAVGPPDVNWLIGYVYQGRLRPVICFNYTP